MSIEIYVPPAANISNITNANPCVITTELPHGYSSGIYCTIVIPYPNVMEEINGKTYYMVPIAPTQLIPVVTIIPSPSPTLVFLDTTHLSPFTLGPLVRCVPHAPLPPVPFFVHGQKSQVVPAGEIATTLANASNVIGPNNPP